MQAVFSDRTELTAGGGLRDRQSKKGPPGPCSPEGLTLFGPETFMLLEIIEEPEEHLCEWHLVLFSIL